MQHLINEHQLSGHALLEAAKELSMRVQLLLPQLLVDMHELVKLLRCEIFDACPVEVLVPWHKSKESLGGSAFAVYPVGDPFKDTHVFTKARPNDFAVVVGAEPVYAKDPRWIGDHVAHLH